MKYLEVEIKQLEDGGYMGTPKTTLGCVVYRDTRSDTVSAIHNLLISKGYEISNLAEIQGRV